MRSECGHTMERRRSDDPVRRANLDDVHQELRGRYLNHPKQLGAFVVRRVREVQVAAGKELRADGDQVRAKIELIEIACTCRVSGWIKAVFPCAAVHSSSFTPRLSSSQSTAEPNSGTPQHRSSRRRSAVKVRWPVRRAAVERRASLATAELRPTQLLIFVHHGA